MRACVRFLRFGDLPTGRKPGARKRGATVWVRVEWHPCWVRWKGVVCQQAGGLSHESLGQRPGTVGRKVGIIFGWS